MIKYYNLWKKFKEEDCEQAREQLILNYLSIVKYHTGRINMLVPNFIDKEDLESYGIIGLINAVENFDYTRGIEFSTFADKRVKGAIIDYLRELDWLPASMRREAKKVKRTVKEMEGDGQKPTMSEVSEKLNISKDRLKNIYQKVYSSEWVSLYNETGDEQILDFLEGNKKLKPDNQFQQNQARKLLKEALEKLPENEYLVISLYYYEELSQKEISSIMEVSASRVSQLHKKAVYRLRGSLSRKKTEIVGSIG